MRRSCPLAAATLLLTLSAGSVFADRITLDKPVTVSTVKADRKPLEGRVVAYDDEGFELVRGRDKAVTVRWDELGAPGQFNVRAALLGAGATGEQWAELGRKMLEVEGGATFADRAFARAVKLNPKLKAEVDEAKAAKPQAAVGTGKPTDATDAAPGARDKDDTGDAQGKPGTMAGPQVVGRVDARTWGTLADDEQAAQVERLKAFAEAAGKKLNKRLTLNETKYFLFYSDLPPREAAKWAGLLDRMYGRLAELFAVKKDAAAAAAHAAGGARVGAAAGAGSGAGGATGGGAARPARAGAGAAGGAKNAGGAYANVWYGKALVFVFQKADDYRQFQIRVHQSDPGSSDGMCHCFGDGTVHIAFYRQPDELTFAHVLVHESVHGFVHRFRAPPTVPSWANEGLAEVIASELVPRPARANDTASQSRAFLQQYGGMGGMLEARHIAGWQYPVAESLCAFMIRQNKRHYVDFILGIKEGLTWEESLEQRYKAPRDRLVKAFGESLNVRGLKE